MNGIQYHTRRVITKIAIEVVLTIFLIFMIIPFLWIIATSLRPVKESFTLPPAILPTQFQWENYLTVFQKLPFSNFVFNSLMVSVISVVVQIGVNSLAAYAFSRITFPGRNILFIFILAGLMIPHQVTIIPLFVLMVNIGLINTRAGLILPSITFPLTLFLMRQFMMTIPSSFEDAAYIDGANRIKVFFHVIFPMVKPTIAVAAVLHFVYVWNDFFRPLILISNPKRMTMPLGLRVLNGYMGSGNLSVVLAGVVLSLIVPLTVFIFAQKYLIEGMRIGGLKG